ncbi:MAG: hypothetical protein KF884_11180 [Fimbriimonadaceae bacterium]|nr:hypothetical protein [Fimbriimonadaceae bacterium]QYK58107.1 MAG: hypothetical protein KF884_11180 [Fimbriimonadaceae bacterium]
MKGHTTRASILALATGMGSILSATPTVLVVMPIADILRHREAMVEYALAGHERNIDKRVYHSNGLTLGLFDRVELGLANDFEGTTTWDAKVLLYERPNDGKIAVSAGFTNLDKGRADKYLVARHDFASFRLHGGWYQNDRNRLMVGIDAPIGQDLTLMADFVSGPGSTAWVALSGEVGTITGLVWTVAGGAPMRKSDGYQYSVGLSYTARF